MRTIDNRVNCNRQESIMQSIALRIFLSFQIAVACCIQPATSPRETFGFQRGAAETLLRKVFGALAES